MLVAEGALDIAVEPAVAVWDVARRECLHRLEAEWIPSEVLEEVE